MDILAKVQGITCRVFRKARNMEGCKEEKVEKVKKKQRIMARQTWRKRVLQAVGRGKEEEKPKGEKRCNGFFEKGSQTQHQSKVLLFQLYLNENVE